MAGRGEDDLLAEALAERWPPAAEVAREAAARPVPRPARHALSEVERRRLRLVSALAPESERRPR